MPTFNYCPSVDSSQEESTKVLESVFGDGYSQTVPDGINSIKRVWNVSFTGSISYVNEIRDFLRLRGGTESFDWTPVGEEAGKWKCKNWSKVFPSGNVHKIRATFGEVFE